MLKEVNKLRLLNQKSEEKCAIKKVPIEELAVDDRPWGQGIAGFKTDSKDLECHLMLMQELKFIDVIRNSQSRRP